MMKLFVLILSLSFFNLALASECVAVKVSKKGVPILKLVSKNKKGVCPKNTVPVISGEVGAQGLQGEQGPKGDTGIQGPKGDSGSTDIIGYAHITASATPTVRLYGGALTTNVTVTKQDEGRHLVSFTGNFPNEMLDDDFLISISDSTNSARSTSSLINAVNVTEKRIDVLVFSRNVSDGAYSDGAFKVMLLSPQ